MINLQRLEMFAAVVEAGSFTRAAQTLGLSKAVVSFNIKQLEKDLSVALLARSTRKVTVTEAGEGFYHRCRQLLQDAERVLEDVRGDRSGLHGILRITTTPEYGAKVVVPALAAFAARHPQLRIQHVSSSQNDDLIAGRFDIAIRLGQLSDSTHHAKLIDRFTIFPVVAPHYLNAAGNPEITDLEKLAEAPWLAHSRLATPLSWQVSTPAGKSVLFKVRRPPVIMADSAASLLAFVQSGTGIALLPAWLVADDIAAGRLIRLLPDYHFPRQGIYALYPDTRHLSEKVRQFIDYFQQYVIDNNVASKGTDNG